MPFCLCTIPDKIVSRSDVLPSRSATIPSSLYASQSSSKVKPEAPLSDSSRDWRKSQSGVQKENLPPLRASMSAIEHFNIPEYTEDESVSKLNSPEIAMVSKENVKAQRSAAPPLPSSDTSRPNVLSSASQYEQSSAPLQQTILPSHPLPSVSGAQQPHARNEIEPVGYVSHSAPAAGYAANGVQGDWQSTVDSYQRQQEVSMRASFGVQATPLAHSAEKPMVGMEYGEFVPSQHALAESFVAQQQVQPQGYGLQHLQQTVPNHLSSYQQSSLYSSASAPHPQQHMQQQHHQHQQYDLYSSHNSMHTRSQSMINPSMQSTQPSLYASLQNSGSAGPFFVLSCSSVRVCLCKVSCVMNVCACANNQPCVCETECMNACMHQYNVAGPMQQQTQGYQPHMQTYAHQTPHSMQQPVICRLVALAYILYACGVCVRSCMIYHDISQVPLELCMHVGLSLSHTHNHNTHAHTHRCGREEGRGIHLTDAANTHRLLTRVKALRRFPIPTVWVS